MEASRQSATPPSLASSVNIAFGMVSVIRASSASPSVTFGPGTSTRKLSDLPGPGQPTRGDLEGEDQLQAGERRHLALHPLHGDDDQLARRGGHVAAARPPQPGAGLGVGDHLADELLDVGVALDLDVTLLVCLVPVLDLAVGGELVEVRARDRDVEALVVAKPFEIFGPGSSTR